jgi:hypothetical protein
VSVNEQRERVEQIRSLLLVAQVEPPTEQTAHDLEAIRKALQLAESELAAEVEKAARRREEP